MDTNIRRVVHRLVFGSDIPTRQATEREILAAAERLVPEGFGLGLESGDDRVRSLAVHPAPSRLRDLPAATAMRGISGDPNRHRGAAGRCAAEERGDRSMARIGSFAAGSSRSCAAQPARPWRSSARRSRHDFAERDLPWLYGVVSGLKRDGLVAIKEPAAEYDPDSPVPDLVVALPD